MLPQPFPYLLIIKGFAFQQQRQFFSGIPLIRRRTVCIIHVQFTQAILFYPAPNRCGTDPGLPSYFSHAATTPIKSLANYG